MSREQLAFLIQRIREREREQPAGQTLEESRAAFDALEKVFPLEEDLRREPEVAGGVPAEWIEPPGVDGSGVLLYLHGGGYAVGSLASHRALVGRLARACGMRALSLDYRLAPEHPFPAALEDALAAYGWLRAQNVAAERIVVAGDSAGGGLALATLLSLRDEGHPLPAGAVTLSPWTDLALTGDSIHSKADVDPLLDLAGAEAYARHYLDGRDPRTPLTSPLYADLRGLPPLLILVGTAEMLLDDSLRFAERAAAAGVRVHCEPWEEMIHVWPFFAPMLDEGRQAIERIGAFVRDLLESP